MRSHFFYTAYLVNCAPLQLATALNDRTHDYRGLALNHTLHLGRDSHTALPLGFEHSVRALNVRSVLLPMAERLAHTRAFKCLLDVADRERLFPASRSRSSGCPLIMVECLQGAEMEAAE